MSILEIDALQKIRELLSRLTYLKIQVDQVALSVDDVTQKQIDDDKADKLRQADVEALKRKLARDKEEAETRRKEAEVAREKAETEKQLAEIRHQAELEEQQRNMELETKKITIDSIYQGHINSRQATIDLERENKIKDIELIKQKILLVKEMAEAGIIDDMAVGQMVQQLLLGGGQVQAPKNLSSSAAIEEKNVININEDRKDDV